MRHLEAEQERWFLWLPVLFGAGIALYFSLAVGAVTSVACCRLGAALALHQPTGGVEGALNPTAAVLTMARVAAAKLRTEAVRAPVLQARWPMSR